MFNLKESALSSSLSDTEQFQRISSHTAPHSQMLEPVMPEDFLESELHIHIQPQIVTFSLNSANTTSCF